MCNREKCTKTTTADRHMTLVYLFHTADKVEIIPSDCQEILLTYSMMERPRQTTPQSWGKGIKSGFHSLLAFKEALKVQMRYEIYI